MRTTDISDFQIDVKKIRTRWPRLLQHLRRTLGYLLHRQHVEHLLLLLRYLHRQLFELVIELHLEHLLYVR